MTGVLCFQAVSPREERWDQGTWKPAVSPRFFTAHHAAITLDLPTGYEATCNGLPVIGGIQVVQQGDLVRIRRGKRQWCYWVGFALAESEPGRDRPDDLTGWPIRGDALQCVTCGALFAAETVAQSECQCANCQMPLCEDYASPPPPEAL
jgi:hypothetical protein